MKMRIILYVFSTRIYPSRGKNTQTNTKTGAISELVIGSDNNAGGSWSTGGTVKEFGVDYTFSNWVWNPNYTWSKGHKVQVFSKELVGRNYPDETWRPLPIQFTK